MSDRKITVKLTEAQARAILPAERPTLDEWNKRMDDFDAACEAITAALKADEKAAA